MYVTPATSWKMEVARGVEAHVQLVSVETDVIRVQQDSTLGKLSVCSVPQERASWEIYVLVVAQDAVSVQISTLARLVKQTPFSPQTLVVLANKVSNLTPLPTRAFARLDGSLTQIYNVPIVIHLVQFVMI